ncbi:MAG: hypothetical protein QXD43_05205 [Candidatus Aenigmatarchaeota archaeon]
MNKLIIISILLLLINISYAQKQDSITPIVTHPCKFGKCDWQDFIMTIQKALRAILKLGYWIAALCGLAGAIMIMLGGTMGTLNKGKKLLFTATIGYALLLSAGILFDLFLDFLRPRLSQ